MSAYERHLTDVAARTLETLCFCYPMPLLSNAHRDAQVDAAMSVAFRGPISGRLVVRVCGGMLGALASNMLGDADADTRMQRDALGEVANVMCGTVIPLIGGSHVAFVLGAPLPVVVLGHVKPHPVAEASVGLEQSGRVDVFLYLEAA